MSRDPKKLRAFHLADQLVVDIYKSTQHFPVSERFGLQAQVRRAAVSVPANIVEGSARRTTREYLYFLNVAVGSANEARYLLTLAARLGFAPMNESEALAGKCTALVATLVALIRALEHER